MATQRGAGPLASAHTCGDAVGASQRQLSVLAGACAEERRAGEFLQLLESCFPSADEHDSARPRETAAAVQPVAYTVERVDTLLQTLAGHLLGSDCQQLLSYTLQWAAEARSSALCFADPDTPCGSETDVERAAGLLPVVVGEYFVPTHTRNDGECQLSGLCLALVGNDGHRVRLRLCVAAEMISNPEFYLQCEGASAWRSDGSASARWQLVDMLRRSVSLGVNTGESHSVAASRVLQVVVCVFCPARLGDMREYARRRSQENTWTAYIDGGALCETLVAYCDRSIWENVCELRLSENDGRVALALLHTRDLGGEHYTALRPLER